MHCAGIKKEEQQKSYLKVKIGNKEIKNVLEFEYLGASVPNDGDPEDRSHIDATLPGDVLANTQRHSWPVHYLLLFVLDCTAL